MKSKAATPGITAITLAHAAQLTPARPLKPVVVQHHSKHVRLRMSMEPNNLAEILFDHSSSEAHDIFQG